MADDISKISILPGKRRLKVTILMAFLGLLIITVLIIAGFTYYRGSCALISISSNLINQVSRSIEEKTGRFLEPVAKVAEMSSRLAGSGMLSFSKRDRLEDYGLSICRIYPQIAIFDFGDNQGNFLMVTRQVDGSLATKVVDRTASPPVTIWKYRDASGKVIKTEKTTVVKYDPRFRPWYRGAEDGGKLFWTDMYIFFASKQPGICASFPVADKNGKVQAVVGMDIALSNLSSFLKRLKIGRSGLAFIINERFELIAFPELSATTVAGKNGVRPALLTELKQPWVYDFIRLAGTHKNGNFTFSSDKKAYLGSLTDLSGITGKPWKIGIVVPKRDFTAVIDETNLTTLFISLIILVVAVLVSIRLSHSISNPMVLLTKEVGKIQDFHLDDKISLKTSILEIQMMTDALESMKSGLRAFKKYVPASLVRRLILTGQEAEIGGSRRELTMLFSDIEGFTNGAENVPPEVLLPHVSEYFDALSAIIMENNGTIDKYIGDSVMAFWNAPVDDVNHAFNACKAALCCQNKLRELNRQWKVSGKMEMKTRIGIHSGPVAVGNIGSSERMNYTILGDNVNLASRLEGVNKVYGTGIIISEYTRNELNGFFLLRPLDKVAVKGRIDGVMIYELVAERDSASEENVELCESFSRAYELFMRCEWEEAAVLYRQILERFPDDQPSAIHLQRCSKYQDTAPDSSWDGIIRLNSK